METIAIHLCEVHYQMAIVCDICWEFASMTMQNIETISQCAKRSVTKCTERNAHKVHGKVQKLQDLKKESKSHKLNKASKPQGQKGVSELLRSGEHRLTKDAAKKSCWAYSLLPSHPSEGTLMLSLNDSTFLSQMVWHCVLEWTLTQSDELSHPFH